MAPGVKNRNSEMEGKTQFDSKFCQRTDEEIDGYGGNVRDRIWNRRKVFRGLLAQAAAFNASFSHVVKAFQATGDGCSSNTSGYSQAVGRFPLELLERILAVSAGLAESGPPEERRVLHIDGVSFTLADTEENRARYDVPSGQAPGCGFPTMSALAVRSDETGAFLSVFPGKWKVHDFRLFIEALAFFRKGDLVVGDRALCAFASMGLLVMLGADIVARLHQKRKFDRSKAKRNADGSWTVVWRKGSHSPKSPVSKEMWESLPDEITVRIIEGVVERKGFRSEHVFIATTLLDCAAYPAERICKLYRRRWKIEESFRDLKDSMGYGFIRSRKPDTVMKTLAAALVAHNLACAAINAAARRHRVDRDRISFKGAVTSFRLFLMQRLVAGKPVGIANFRRMLWSIATDRVPERPGRREPRAVKKRPKPYPLLTSDRHTYQEIPHRSRYRKTKKLA